MADRNGMAGAVAGLLDEAKAELPTEAEQLDLLVAENRPSGERLRYDAAALAREVERTGKAGRPKGAQNLATRELKAWIVRLLGGTPQERLAQWAMLQPEELAKRLGCTVAEAFDRQVAILKELAPYLMARMAQVDDRGNAVPIFQMVFGNQVAGGGDTPPWMRAFQHLEGEATDITPSEDER